nr:helix-turn-helix domain-containing protein [Microbacterium sp. ABRD28]
MLIKAVTVQGLSYRQVATRYGVSKSLVHKLHHRWLTEGEAAFDPQSRRPRSSPNRTPQRHDLAGHGLDGPDCRRSSHPAASETTALLMAQVLRGSTQRALAIRLHPRPAQHRTRRGSDRLAR